jgi:hypothetical protein
MSLTGGHSSNPRLPRFSSASVWLLRGILGGARAETLIRALSLDDLRSLYYLSLMRTFYQSREARKTPLTSFSYYEFGVGWGYTLTRYIDALKAFCHDKSLNLDGQRIILFDSFEGLPEKQGAEDDHLNWYKGSFAHTIDEIKELLRQANIETGPRSQVRFVKGVYEESLTPDLRQQLSDSPPDIITIDCDYYSSTRTVLNWLRPILRSGSLIYFDDLWSFDGSPNKGEIKAINEFNKHGEGLLVSFPLVSTLSSLLYVFTRD